MSAKDGTSTNPPHSSAEGKLLVFLVRRDTKCAECGEELLRSRMIALEKNRGALCLKCADLDHLQFLPSGNTALTRRATKHSQLHAVVLQWSRTRNRYERQGVLIEPEALEQAEAECLSDAERRERQRERRRIRDAELDQKYVAAFAHQIREFFPKCPSVEADRIAQHACRKYSGRVGRSASAKAFEPEAVRLAVTAAVRHGFTNYDKLLLRGVDRHEARAFVRDAVEKQIDRWSGH